MVAADLVLGYRAVQQGVLGVARVVEPGFGSRVCACMGVCLQVLRWTCGGGHGAVPAMAGCRHDTVFTYNYHTYRLLPETGQILLN